MDGSGEPCRRRRQAESLLFIQRQKAIRAPHLLPVIFVGRATTGTDLIVLAIAGESRPSKSMEAKFPEQSLQDFHVCRSLRTDQTQWRDLFSKAAYKSI